jgi:hypothetical protein
MEANFPEGAVYMKLSKNGTARLKIQKKSTNEAGKMELPRANCLEGAALCLLASGL